MRVVMIWRDNEDYSRTVRDWLHDFEHRLGKMPESFSPDEGEGFVSVRTVSPEAQ